MVVTEPMALSAISGVPLMVAEMPLIHVQQILPSILQLINVRAIMDIASTTAKQPVYTLERLTPLLHLPTALLIPTPMEQDRVNVITVMALVVAPVFQSRKYAKINTAMLLMEVAHPVTAQLAINGTVRRHPVC